MATVDEAYGVNHRHQKWMVAGISAVALLLALAPRQERALFIIDGPQVRAFGVTLPPINLAQILLPFYEGGGGSPRIFGPLRSFLARTGVPGLPGATPGAPGAPFAPPAAVAPQGPGFPFGAPPIAPAAGPGITNPFPFPGGTLTPPTANPVAPITDVPVVPPVTPAIPEPATWAMMIAGFLLAGLGLRRRRHSSSRRVFRKVTEPS